MLTSDERERIRRAYHVDGKSIRQIAREEKRSREAVKQAIEDVPPLAQSQPHHHSAPVFGPYQARVDALLQQNELLPRKQRYTSPKIFEIIRAEGYQGCESRIRQHVAEWNRTRKLEVFLPLEFEPGQDAQCDWGEAVALINEERRKVQVFTMRLCYSRRTFVTAFPTQNQESFLYGHVLAFNYFGGVPYRISYDNLATAVKMAFDRPKQRGRPLAKNSMPFRPSVVITCSSPISVRWVCTALTRKEASSTQLGTRGATTWFLFQRLPLLKNSISSSESVVNLMMVGVFLASL